MDAAALLIPRPAKRAALRTARHRLQLARDPIGLALGAALTEPLGHTPRQWVRLLLVAAVPVALLLAASRWLLAFWHEVLLWWAPRLGLPLQQGSAEPLVWRGLEGVPGLGGPLALAGMGVLALAVFTASLWLGPRQRTLRHVLWALGVVVGGAAALATWAPEALPQSAAVYLSAMLHAGLVFMLALPVLLAAGFSGVAMRPGPRLACMAAMLCYFALMLPHKMLLLALLLQLLPLAWGPLLFGVLGIGADLLVALALFAWLSSAYPLAIPGPGRGAVPVVRRR